MGLKLVSEILCWGWTRNRKGGLSCQHTIVAVVQAPVKFIRLLPHRNIRKHCSFKFGSAGSNRRWKARHGWAA